MKCFALINADLGYETSLGSEIQKISEVSEVHFCLGGYDLIVLVEQESIEDIRDTLHAIRHLKHLRSLVSLIESSEWSYEK